MVFKSLATCSPLCLVVSLHICTDPCRIFHTPKSVDIKLDFDLSDDTRLALAADRLYVVQHAPSRVLSIFQTHSDGARSVSFKYKFQSSSMSGCEYLSLEVIGGQLYCIRQQQAAYEVRVCIPVPNSEAELGVDKLIDKPSAGSPSPSWHDANSYLKAMQVIAPPYAIAGDLSLYEEILVNKDGDYKRILSSANCSFEDDDEDLEVSFSVRVLNRYMTMVANKHGIVKTINRWILYASGGKLIVASEDLETVCEELGDVDIPENAKFRMWWDERRGFLYFWSEGHLSAYSVMYTENDLHGAGLDVVLDPEQ